MSFYEWFTTEREDLTPLPREEFLFGTRHVLVLCLIVIAVCLLTIFFYKKDKKDQDKVFNVLAGILIFGEVLVRVARMTKIIVEGLWTFPALWYALMPNFVCSIVVWTLIINHFVKWKPLTNAGTLAGLVATGGFYLWPGAGFNTVEVPFLQIYSIVSHSIALIYFLLLVIYHRAQFKLEKYYEPWIYFAVALFYSWMLNLFVFPGENYMYFMYDNMTYWAIPNPWWQVFLFFALLFTISAFFVPDLIKRLIKKKTVKAS